MGWFGRAVLRGLGAEGRGEERRGEVRIRVSTLVVHPMQDTARHDLRSPRHIPDAPCKVSRGVSTATVRYVIRSRMVNSLHDGALPVVVLFARHGPHIQPVAYQCANLEYVPSFVEKRRRASRVPSLSLSSLSSFASISSFAFHGKKEGEGKKYFGSSKFAALFPIIDSIDPKRFRSAIGHASDRENLFAFEGRSRSGVRARNI